MQAQFDQNKLQQAQSLHQAGHFSKAETLYGELAQSNPGHPIVLARLGLLYSQTKRAREGLACFAQAIEILPNELSLLVQGADIAAKLADNEKAVTWLKMAYQLNPLDETILEKLAGSLIGMHKEKEALELIKTAIKNNPKSANAYNLKGLALCRLGDTDKGYKSFQKALKLNPGQLAVIKNLIIYGKNKKEPMLDSIVPQLEQRVMQTSQPPMVRMNLAYVVSQYYEKQKNPDKAFRFLKMGNDLNRSSYQYQHHETEKQFEALINLFTEDLLASGKDHGIDSDAPIFILGMPRSGTTLIEQILSSHSLVEAEGEISDLKHAFESIAGIVFSERLSQEKAEAVQKAAKQYVDSVRTRNKAQFFTDKMPYNFMLVGVIAMAMPNAKIIHCTRDPLETCFSIYKQNFAGSHAYTNNMQELGAYYKLYQHMMAEWGKRFPDRLYEANYESMVENSEEEIKNLLAFCGLEEEAACFEFHKNKRAVRTASVTQVRQPIYKDAMKASYPYRKMLEPLIKALDS